MRIETENKGFEPVKLVLETQAEVDKLYVLLRDASSKLYIKDNRTGLKSDEFFMDTVSVLSRFVNERQCGDNYNIEELQY